jgi:hypothetical protein
MRIGRRGEFRDTWKRKQSALGYLAHATLCECHKNLIADLHVRDRVLVNTWNEANPGLAARPNSARTLSGSRSKQ